MASNPKLLADVTVDEIALEGMDGLTIDSKPHIPTNIPNTSALTATPPHPPFQASGSASPTA